MGYSRMFYVSTGSRATQGVSGLPRQKCQAFFSPVQSFPLIREMPSSSEPALAQTKETQNDEHVINQDQK